MSISATTHIERYNSERDPREVFAELMNYSRAFPTQKPSSTPNNGLLADSTAAPLVQPGNFSSGAIPVQPDSGNPQVLGSITQHPDSYYGNQSLKEAHFHGHTAKLNAPVNDLINARLGASNDGRMPVTTDGNSDLQTDALSSYTAQLKSTSRSDAGAYHYGQSPAVALDHGLASYQQIINLAGSKQSIPIA